jgi:hypothetical protein
VCSLYLAFAFFEGDVLAGNQMKLGLEDLIVALRWMVEWDRGPGPRRTIKWRLRHANR